MKIKKTLGLLLTLVLMLSSLAVKDVAKADDFEISGIKVVGQATDITIKPGETKHIKLAVATEGNALLKAFVDVEADSKNLMSATTPILTRDGVEGTVNEILNNSNSSTYVEFDVTAKSSATIGVYPITLKFHGFNYMNEYVSNDLNVTLNLKVKQENEPANLIITNVDYKDMYIGGTGKMVLTIKNDGGIDIKESTVKVDYKSTGIIPNYTNTKIKIGAVAAGKTTTIDIPVKVLSTETVGLKSIGFELNYKDVDGTSGNNTSDIYAEISEDENLPKLEIVSTSFSGSLTAGKDVNLVVKVSNKGLSRAKNVTIALDAETTTAGSFVKNYYTSSVACSTVKEDGTAEFKLPLSISKQSEAGVKNLGFIITYDNGTSASKTLKTVIYPEVKAAEGTTSDGKPNLIISNVSQSSQAPQAGEKLTIRFTAENKSDTEIKELKISVGNYSNTTFIPVDSEPYFYINNIKGGKKVQIEIPVQLSKSIPEGLNNLTVNYSYVDANGNSSAENTITIPVLNVQNESGSGISKPKLIISNYKVDPTELKAGSNFTFNFEITNTNRSVSATNITIKVSQAEGIFTPLQGGNSFYVAKIGPNETKEFNLEMKAKSDAMTKLYPVTLEIEYEYDGAEPNPTTGEIGEKATENLNVQVIENARPVIDNIGVYSMDGMICVNNQATLSFEFYNMGKSQLNNVIARVEGDFEKMDGDMYFIGNVQSGYSDYIEFDVTPLIEGTAKGNIIITFEDSNGDEVSYNKEFESEVMSMDTGFFGGDDMGPIYDDAFNNTTAQAKKVILPTWVFILILPVTFLLGLFVTRGIIISEIGRAHV